MKVKIILLFLIYFTCTSILLAEEKSLKKTSELFKVCAKCHGKDGKHKAYGRSEPIAGMDAQDLKENLIFFQESVFDNAGVMRVMSKQVKNLSKQDIEDLAKYISNL
ncbi:MAG: c-type cytochrome [Sulfurospirillum sp.]|nr:c-type cytochrome [Sulfurospirillum sp.]